MSDLPFMTSKTLLPKRWQYSYLAFFAHGYSPRVHFAARSRFGPTALACCAGKRFAFPQLRTLAGSNPMKWARKRKGLHRWRPNKSVVGDEGCPRAASPPAFASSLRSSRAALENAYAFPQLRTLAGSNPSAMGPKKERPPSLEAFSIKWWAMRDSNPQPCACKAPALTVAPIARRD